MKENNSIQNGELPEEKKAETAVSVKNEKENKLLSFFRESGEKAAQKRADNDVIFTEPLHPAPPKDETKPLTRGSVDTWFLLIAMLLVCFGAVMSYSASAVYAEFEYGDSAHFSTVFKKHYFTTPFKFIRSGGIIFQKL